MFKIPFLSNWFLFYNMIFLIGMEEIQNFKFDLREWYEMCFMLDWCGMHFIIFFANFFPSFVNYKFTTSSSNGHFNSLVLYDLVKNVAGVLRALNRSFGIYIAWVTTTCFSYHYYPSKNNKMHTKKHEIFGLLYQKLLNEIFQFNCHRWMHNQK